MAKTVAIVGAGAAGLVAVKTCLEEGFKPRAFEKRNCVGGLWNYVDDDSLTSSGRMYKSLVTNTSAVMSCFSDFPFPKKTPVFLRHHEYAKYFQDYADHFGLKDYIHLNTEVIKIEQAEDYDVTGRWTVHVRHDGAAPTKDTYDFVMVCSGYFTVPNMPSIPGEDEFGGKIIHTAQYRSSAPYIDKNVVVVGACVSGADISADISNVAKQVYFCIPNGLWVFERRGKGGWAFDMITFRRFKVSFLPFWLWEAITEGWLYRNTNYEALGIKPPRRLFRSTQSLSDSLIVQMMCGKIEVTTKIKRLIPNGVEFEDGSKQENIDAIVLGTGYHLKTQFIDDKLLSDDLRTRDLYMHTLPIRLLHPTLACIGLLDKFGFSAAFFEQQCRWTVRVFKGDIKLPPVTDMKKDIENRMNGLHALYGRDRYRVLLVELVDTFAEEMGCYPHLKKFILTDPKLALALFLTAPIAASYRLIGPHSWPGARDEVLNCWKNSFPGLRGTVRRKPSFSPYLWVFCIVLLLGILLYFVMGA